jgi:hypothetical protein
MKATADTLEQCMADVIISVINASTIVHDDEVETVTRALQQQVSRDFAPVWGVDATLNFIGKGAKASPGSWWLTILDNTDQAGALGYHDLTSESMPIGKVFAGTDKQYGLVWSVTASHELLEMLGDPDINLTVFVQPDDKTGTLYAYEVCDPCEDDAFAYEIDGVKVSDFVYPAYFESFRKARSTRFDHQGHLTAPVPALLNGGYLSAFNVGGGTGWNQITAARPSGRIDRAFIRNRVSSRRERRRLPRNQWALSIGLGPEGF